MQNEIWKFVGIYTLDDTKTHNSQISQGDGVYTHNDEK